MQKIPVFIISLKNADSRRKRIKQHLEDLGINYEFIDAIRGDALSIEERNKFNPGGNLSPGALGCYLSHISVYERIVSNDISTALVLEDDTILHYSVKTLLTEGVNSSEFDYCFLGCDDRGDDGYVYYDSNSSIALSKQHKAFTLSSGPYCTNAYLISLDGAKRRLSFAFPAKAPIDHYRPLPYKPRFMITIGMMAFVNEESAMGSMSSVNWSELQKNAKKHWWYYPTRDILKFNYIRKFLHLRSKKLPKPGSWKIFSSGFRVVKPEMYEQPGLH